MTTQIDSDEDSLVCEGCGDTENARSWENSVIMCDTCWEQKFTFCNGCDEAVRITEVIVVHGSEYCEGCAEDTHSCENCGQVEWSDNTRRVGSSRDYNELWCERCADFTYYCESCDINHTEDDECYSRHRGVRNYSYKPHPEFHHVGEPVTLEPRDNTTYMGFEVEVEAHHGDLYAGADLFSDMSFVYLKEDGSLNEGFEIVSHPATMAYYNNMSRLWDKFTSLSELGFRSWRTSTCGIHIHVGRSAFRNKAHLWRFAYFINSHPDQCQMFAGRHASRWATFENQKQEASKIIAGKVRYYPQRYVAVNLSNSTTVEVRMFRGSLLPRRILANLGFVDAVVEFTRNKSVKDVNDKGATFDRFVDFVLSKPDGNGEYDSLRYYLTKYFRDGNTTN